MVPPQPHLIPLVYNLSQVETRTFSQIQNNDTFDKSNLERNDVNGRAGTVPRHSDTVQLSILILLLWESGPGLICLFWSLQYSIYLLSDLRGGTEKEVELPLRKILQDYPGRRLTDAT